MRIKQARPDPEKAAKMQELHRKLRVCFITTFILKARCKCTNNHVLWMHFDSSLTYVLVLAKTKFKGTT